MSLLCTRDLSKRYGSLIAVDALNLDLAEGEILGLLGPNGAGKTTTVSMLCGLLQPDSGEVVLRGKRMGPQDRTRVGICPQHIVVWKDLSCLDQLVFVGQSYGVARRQAQQRGMWLLDALGLQQKAQTYARALSGGMQRRLNIALALIHEPEIVVLDEPEAGLDPQSRVLVREFIRALAQRASVVVTTHNMDEAERIANRVAIIDHGKLLACDSPHALMQKFGPGDVLELSIEGEIERARAVVAALDLSVVIEQESLQIRALSMVSRLGDILHSLEQAEIKVRELHVRSNTLEDVFIALTGRRIRQ